MGSDRELSQAGGGLEFEPFFDVSLELLGILGLDGRLKRANASWKRILGYTPQELQDRPLLALVHPEDQEGASRRLRDLQAGRPVEGFECRLRAKNGTDHRLSWNWAAQPGKELIYAVGRDVTGRQKREDERYQALFGAHPVPMWVYDRDTQAFMAVNDAAVEQYGYSREEFLGMRITDVRPKGDVPRWVRQMPEALQNARYLGGWRHRKKDGTVIDVEIVARPVEFEGHRGELILATDVTARARAEAALKLRTEALDAAANGIVITDREGVIVWTNAAMTALTGYSASEFAGRSPRLLKSGCHDRAFYQGLWETILRGDVWHGEVVNRRRDGSLYTEEMTVTPVRDRKGDISNFIAIKQDVTERKRIEEALTASERRYRVMFERSIASILRTTLDGRILYANRALAGLLGYDSAEELCQHPVTDIWYEPEEREEFLRNLQAAPDRNLTNLEKRLKKKNGEPIWTLANVVLAEEAGQPVIDGTMMDLSAQKAAAADLQELTQTLDKRVKQRTAEIEAFAYSVSHDLRTPLRHIDGFARILLNSLGPSLDERSHRHLRAVRDAADHMSHLVDDLLEFSRMGRQQLVRRKVDLNELLQEVLAELDQEGRSIEWRVGTLPTIEGDRALIRQVFVNLLANAVKYTRPQPQPVVEVNKTELDGADAVFVRDNGVGFDMKYADKLFGVFQRLHRPDEFEGTGVGLATVQNIINRHGGRVWAEAEEGKGATFYFTVS